MAAPNVRRAFIVFHVVLGISLLIASIQTLAHALHELGGRHGHLAIVASFEAIGALLFLIPKMLRAGAVLLLITVLGALAVHTYLGQWRLDLLVYAAGVWFVMAHGSAWRAQPQPVDPLSSGT